MFFYPINVAVDTSTFIILFSSLAGFITYLRQKRTSVRLSLMLAGFSILGSIFSSILFSFVHIDSYLLKMIFASTLLIAGLNMIYKTFITKKRNKFNESKIAFSLETHDYKTNFKKSIPYFILAGFVANFLGIGGGIINSPSLNIVLQYPIHNSTAISTSIVFFTAIYNTIIKSITGQIDIIVGIAIAIGSIIGSIIGAKISKKMPKFYLQLFVAIVLMSLAIYMFF